ARRAYPLGLSIEEKADEVCVICAQDGYRRLPTEVTHYRTWRFRLDGFTINDQLDGRFASAASYVHLHPTTRLLAKDRTIECPDGYRLLYRVQNGKPNVMHYAYHPQFGLSLPAHCLKVEMASAPCTIGFTFA